MQHAGWLPRQDIVSCECTTYSQVSAVFTRWCPRFLLNKCVMTQAHLLIINLPTDIFLAVFTSGAQCTERCEQVLDGQQSDTLQIITGHLACTFHLLSIQARGLSPC